MKHGWEIKKLGDICETSSGGTPSKSHPEYYENGNILWLRSGEISQGYIYKTELYITEEGLKKSSAKIFPTDTVVIAMYGATVGQVGILKREMSTNQAVCGIFPTPMLYPLFLVYYLKAKKAYFLSIAAGGAQPNISQNIIKNTPIPIPPIEVQEKIVAELDCLSGIIEKKKQQLKEYDALAQSIFYEMFGNSVGDTNKWNTCCIGDIYKFQYGKGNKIPESRGEFPCYGSNGQVGYHTEYNSEDAPIIGHIGAYAGIVNWASGKHYVTYNGVICNLKNEAFNPIYGFYLLKAQNYLENARGGAAQPFVSYDMLEAPITHIPPLSLQQEFASKIEAIEKQKELIKQSIVETETLFNSRMDYYFN